MEFSHSYTSIDAHTAGEPLRIITSGVPFIPGDTILAKRQWVQENLDHVRRALMHEPRGHADMYGCYITPAVSAQADFGVIFMHNEGYSSMCGHGIIAVASVAVATGMVPAQQPETRVGIDSPAGFIEAFVAWDGRKVGAVRFVNVPSFLYATDVSVPTPSFGTLQVDIAFGGAFYAYLEASQAQLSVTPAHYRALIALGDEVKQALTQQRSIVHPQEPQLQGLYGTIIDDGVLEQNGQLQQRNVCIFADREVDRSPTGTGTAGRMAQLYARGKLRPGQSFHNASIIGSSFEGQVLGETKVGDFAAIIPEVSGSAYITGYNHWLIDPDDPLGQGFFLR